MEKNKVTSKELREMAVGESRTFLLPSDRAIEAGKALAYRIRRLGGGRFSASANYNNKSLTLTKIALT